MLRAVRYPLLFCFLTAAIFFANAAWIHVKAGLAQLLIERAWSETLATGRAVSPWPWADFWPVARMFVEQSGEKLFVLSSASGESLAFGPGHVNGSALPATAGESIIAAHRDTHFEFLKNSKLGDVVKLQGADGRSINYQLSDIQVVDSRYAKLNIEAGKTGLKLVTCYPFDAVLPGGPKRLVVQFLPQGRMAAG